MTLLSIVTISYNQFEFLDECLASVTSQIQDDVEYIVVDPGSTDGSRELIQSYGAAISPIFDLDEGPPDGLNKGFEIAKGDYFYFLNSDDVLLPGAVDAMLTAIHSSANIDVFCFAGYLVDRQLRRLRFMRSFRFSAQRFCRGNTSVFQQGLMFSSRKFREVSGFNKTNRTCWDAELAVQMSLSGATFADRPEKIAYFRIYETSITGSATNLEENTENKNRLYKQTFGKEPNWVSLVVYKLVKFEKYLYPTYFFATAKLLVVNLIRSFS